LILNRKLTWFSPEMKVVLLVQFRRISCFYHGEMPFSIGANRWLPDRTAVLCVCVGFTHELAPVRGERSLTVAVPVSGLAQRKLRALTT